MVNEKNNNERYREIVEICLNEFIEKGLFNTSVRDLADTLQMQPSGLYYHFKNKDDIVVACAEKAGIELEDVLILPVLDYLDDEQQYVTFLMDRVQEMVPMMKFFTQVCTTKEYRADMQPVLDRLKKRHKEYSIMFAKRLRCEPEEIAPYLYACVAIVANYMIFGEDFYYVEPFKLLRGAIEMFRGKGREQLQKGLQEGNLYEENRGVKETS